MRTCAAAMMGAPSRAYMPASDPKQIIMATAEWITFRSVTTASPPPRIPMASTTKRTLVMSRAPTPVAAGSSRTHGPAQAPILAYEHVRAADQPRLRLTAGAAAQSCDGCPDARSRDSHPCDLAARRLVAHPSAGPPAPRAGGGGQPGPLPHAAHLP